jgi:hypothetical protein
MQAPDTLEPVVPPGTTGPSTTSKDSWAAKAVHTITCPSGARIKIRLPNLSLMIKNDLLPSELRAVAISKVMEEAGSQPAASVGTATGPEITADTVKKMVELNESIIVEMVVEPLITKEDLEANVIPPEDLDFLSEIAQRERHTDALGVSLGVEPLSRWDTFRHEHGCAEDCAACEAVRRRFSSRYVDQV